MENELAKLWESKTGLDEPSVGTFTHLLYTAPAGDVAAAIRKTGRAVRRAAGGDRPFSVGSAVSYCRTVLGSRASARSATVEAR
jgi:hypothetical protein